MILLLVVRFSWTKIKTHKTLKQTKSYPKRSVKVVQSEAEVK